MSDFELAHAYDTVNLHRRGGAALIELNRPDRLNAWNRQFGIDLLAALESVAQDDEVRAVAIRGAGRAFSSGADLNSLGEGSEDDVTPAGRPDVYKVLTERYHPIITGIRRMPKPGRMTLFAPRCSICPTAISTTTAGCGLAWRSRARLARTGRTCSRPGLIRL